MLVKTIMCRITVHELMRNDHLIDEFMPGAEHLSCHLLKEGDVFYTKGFNMPVGFPCGPAWNCLEKKAAICANRDSMPEKPLRMVACCNDAFRPVVFVLEPVEMDVDPKLVRP